MPAVRPCRSCGDFEAEPRKQVCYECWLRKQPPTTRQEAARRRLALIPEKYRIAKVDKKKWPEGRRWCAGCQSFVLLEDAVGSKCKTCNTIAGHKSRTMSRFGIDEATYRWLFIDVQKGRCGICGRLPRSKSLAIDHDHACEVCGGKSGCLSCVRGLLCSACNHDLLGAAHDSVAILEAAVAYLKTPPMSGDWTPPPWVPEDAAPY